MYEDGFYPQVGLNAVAGRPKAEWSMEPARFDEMRRGCYDIEARVADMDLDGVYATLCFPSLIAGFAGTIFASSKDPELGLACLRAWNDWHIDEWAGPHPDRIIPLQLAWLQDPEIAAADVRRNAERGFKAVSFPENPVDLGLPSMHTDHWDPFLRACEETADRHLPAQRVVVVDRGALAGRAARAVHVALLRERDGRRGRLAVGAHPHPLPRHPHRVLRGRHRLGADAHRPHRLRARPLRGRLATAGTTRTSRPPTRCAATSGSARSTSRARCRCASTSASTTSAWRATTRTPTRPGPTRSRARSPGLADFTPDEVRKVTWQNASKLFRHPVPDELQLPRPEEA